jgi:metallo-beta-lactamase class B
LRTLTKRDWQLLLIGLATPLLIFVFVKWREAGIRAGQAPVDAFRIAGNFYYVGSNATSVFLLTGPDGHVLLDGGLQGMPSMVMASIATLGFDIRDVKILLSSSAGPDIGGGLAALQRASGAKLWTSAANAAVLEGGGASSDMLPPVRLLFRIGLAGYPAPRVDRRITDGESVRLGPITLTAHVTGGSTPGCTSWSFPVRDADRVLNVVSACGTAVTLGFRYPQQRADIERSLRVLRSLPADIWVTSSSRTWGRYRKFAASKTAKNPAGAFVDPDGYRAYLADAEAEFRSGKTH